MFPPNSQNSNPPKPYPSPSNPKSPKKSELSIKSPNHPPNQSPNIQCCQPHIATIRFMPSKYENH